MSQGDRAGLNPLRIMETGLGFWASKTLLSAAELGVFTELAKGPLKGEDLGKRLGLHPRGRRDFLDTLVALGMLKRAGNVYSNTPETDLFMDRAKPTYVGGLLEMCNARLYGFWGSLTTALKTGKSQNEGASGGDMFAALYADPKRLKQFLQSMTGISLGTAAAIAQKFPWKQYKSFIDLGCAQGALPVTVARAHEHLSGGGFDLPVVGPIFEEYVKSFGLEKRVKFHGGDFLKGEMPQGAEVLVMGHILHDWDMDEKKMLLNKAYAALPAGGALIVYDAIIDDERKSNAFGLMMSLNMLIETTGGFDYTGADCCGWMKEVGFKETRVEHLVGPDSMVVGVK